MALLVLAAEWSVRRGSLAPAISVATVDHGLRPESGDEALFVGREARHLGLSQTILRWDGAKPRTGLADAARQARYQLLEGHARSFAVRRHCGRHRASSG